ncbi:MAG: methyltransferase domain-containing protein [Merismopedia sp. SIO2A8]|nr:methyltransferase domain-containing protein [Merismopedia sp. SIO2A8]
MSSSAKLSSVGAAVDCAGEHSPMAQQVKFIQDFYSERYQDYQADLICCRHTLEHISNPADLLKPLRLAIGNRLQTMVFFEVPNALHTFRNLAVWDIIYEHCCYFAPTSLAQAFSRCGFQICEQSEAFEGQFLCLEALPATNDFTSNDERKHEVEELSKDITTFKAKFDTLVETWEQKLLQMAQAGKKVVAWGAGSKGVTFLNILNNQDSIEYIVDLNPRKQGMYVAGTGQKIVPPEFLGEYKPDVVIIMNPIYEGEIRELVKGLGLTAEFMCV